MLLKSLLPLQPERIFEALGLGVNFRFDPLRRTSQDPPSAIPVQRHVHGTHKAPRPLVSERNFLSWYSLCVNVLTTGTEFHRFLC